MKGEEQESERGLCHVVVIKREIKMEEKKNKVVSMFVAVSWILL